ncbi:hypothetical protein [Actinomadura rudentiformis]|uniref:Class I SAM-dependent methyltransferase n=1 Tax=Actinomadura rudentiformis TaxID=359158 RepID=A0A6H9YW03_9ACTN|nr:hypothetical protein [Actinomadura rudentiformis]KAB2350157.1 hypothetical protein F8566_10190 [Actinomadura rudentiformis]
MGNIDATIPSTCEEILTNSEAIPSTREETLAAWFLGQANTCCPEGDLLELGPETVGASRFCRDGENYLSPDLEVTDWKTLRNQSTKRFRFVHFTATGTYSELLTRIDTARFLLRVNGIVAITGYRAGNNPAAAAAVWHSVLAGTLRPICTTRHRFYGMWGDAAPVQNELLVWLASHVSGYAAEVHSIAKHRILHFNIT